MGIHRLNSDTQSLGHRPQANSVEAALGIEHRNSSVDQRFPVDSDDCSHERTLSGLGLIELDSQREDQSPLI
jgi:hypothetical protein